MIKQRIKEGSILEINIEGQYFVYAQILEKARGYAFFDFRTTDHLTDFSILQHAKVLFIIKVFDDIVKKGYWLKVAQLPVREDLAILPFKFIQDALHPEYFELYDPNTGNTKPSTKEQIRGLERASIWAQNHVEDRIRDYYNNVPCQWLQKDRELFGTAFP